MSCFYSNQFHNTREMSLGMKLEEFMRIDKAWLERFYISQSGIRIKYLITFYFSKIENQFLKTSAGRGKEQESERK